MSDQHNEPERRGFPRETAFVVVVGFMIVYPLSLGPIWFLFASEIIPSDSFAYTIFYRAFFQPVIWLCSLAYPFSKPLLDYYDWWGNP
jgi:hypothetical protein